MQFVVYQDTGGFWYWHLEDDEGQQIAYGSQAFANADEAKRMLRGLGAQLPDSPVVFLPSSGS